MNFAFVLHHYYPYGGLERAALKMAQACKARGHQVEFLTMNWEGEKPTGIPIHFFSKKSRVNYKSSEAFERDVKQFLTEHPYDAVVGFNRMGGLDVYYAADPSFAATLAQSRFAWLKKYLPRYRHILKMEERLCASGAHIFLTTLKVKEEFQQYYQIPNERLHLLPPRVDLNRRWTVDAPERRFKMRKELGLSADEQMLLSIGSQFKTKGVDRSIRALAALPPDLREKTQLWVVGKSSPKRYMYLAQKLGVGSRVHFLLGSDRISDLLQAADLLVHSSRLETAGMVIVEAIAAGLPILVTGVCGYAFYVERAKAGKVLPEPFEQKNLNQALEDMLRQDKREWRENAIRFGQENDLYSQSEKAAELIEQILQG